MGSFVGQFLNSKDEKGKILIARIPFLFQWVTTPRSVVRLVQDLIVSLQIVTSLLKAKRIAIAVELFNRVDPLVETVELRCDH